jgi:ubiquitin-like-conjugating enzyme ATG3
MSPTLKKSQFLAKGVLTPEEFVAAGDELTFRCPTWTWERGSVQRSHLPADRQYLVTRNVPCTSRVCELESHIVDASRDKTGDGEDDDDWMISQVIKSADRLNIEEDFDILDEEGEVMKPPAAGTLEFGNDEVKDDADDEYADMAELEDNNVLEDDALLSPATGSESGDDDGIVKVRTYDLSITYDKYYQTPRLWMVGYDSSGQPLSTEEMMQDVMQDYAHKTVTMERHPHLMNSLHASIHPCRHAQVMKTILANLTHSKDGASNPSPPQVETYLFIFLKFVSSIIPTINYDFTMDVKASTAKY